jgi:hypothetical protein
MIEVHIALRGLTRPAVESAGQRALDEMRIQLREVAGTDELLSIKAHDFDMEIMDRADS